MPLYVYSCSDCNKVEERYCISDKRDAQICGCGKALKREFSSPQLILFQPMVLNDLGTEPIYIETKTQLNEECKKYGVDLEHYGKPKPKGQYYT